MTDFHSLSRSLQKKMARTKEKVLMTIGKADKTTDDDFDTLTKSFNYQQSTANKLLKQFKNYTQQVKGMSTASRQMHTAISEAYEPEWKGAEQFRAISERLASLCDDHYVQVSDFLNFQIASYACKFPELKNKIDKRSRKLLDYDRTRHKLDNLERAKKRNEAKINETSRELDAAQSIYESINAELYAELPNLYDNRMPVLASFFNSFLLVEAKFQEESSKLYRKMLEVNSVLPKDATQMPLCYKSLKRTAKTLPRRCTSSHARYSPQLGSKLSRQGDDRRKTMPTRPLSPPFPAHLIHHPPTEPAPLPPLSSSSSSSITYTSTTATSSAERPPLPTTPPSHPLLYGRHNNTPLNHKEFNDMINYVPHLSSSTPESYRKESNKSTLDGFRDITEEPVGIVENIQSSGDSKQAADKQAADKQAADKEAADKQAEKTAASGIVEKVITTTVIRQEEGGAKEVVTEVNNIASIKADDSTDASHHKDLWSTSAAESDILQTSCTTVQVSDHSVQEDDAKKDAVTLTPPSYLYKVQATNNYTAADTDELSLEAGEVVYVLPIENIDCEDEGWALGLKEKGGVKGMFPINFTRRIV